MDLLRNVWQNVLPDMKYNKTFTELLNDFCNEIIRRIVSMEDISATVANELSELIGTVLEKAPALFKVNIKISIFFLKKKIPISFMQRKNIKLFTLKVG